MLSRPGYAGSDRREGRVIADVADDVVAALDHLGVSRFITAGWSGGGPHALACAALVETRCLAAATIAGVAPYEGAKDLDFTSGMGPENAEEFNALIAGDPSVEQTVRELAKDLRDIQPEQLVAAFGGLLSGPDKDVLVGDVAEFIAEWMRLSMSSGSHGYWDDGQAFIRYWGFDLTRIDVPVTVWIAGQDLMVPPAHGNWLAANVPNAKARIEPDEGHISLMTRHIADIVDQLTADAGVR
jgi:pimeloyl-ACP methyl ester carboxylesterase